MLKFLFFSYENYIASVALRLQEEGNEVSLAQIENKKDTLLPDEMSEDNLKEDPEFKKRRLSIYEGMMKKYKARDVLSPMKKLTNKDDYFVMTDINNSFKFTEQALKMGFKNGFFPKAEDRQFEVDRDLGKDLVKKYWTGIEIKEHQEFKRIEEGIKFLEGNENVYVLKSMGDLGDTVVPQGQEAEIANQTIIDALEADKEKYEANGYLLEQKILDPIEFTPEMVFYNGKPIYSSIDLETKTKDAGELGKQVGCGMNLIIKTELNDPINEIVFPEYVHEQARKRKGLFIWDMGILIDRKDGKMYFTEFCPNRTGWDAFPTEICMSESATQYFNDLVKQLDPIRSKFGVAVRIFNDNKDSEGFSQMDMSLTIDEEVNKYVYPYDVKKVEDKLITAGYQQDLGTVTGTGNTIVEAIDQAYANIGKIAFKELNYRSRDDFMSMSYPQAIMKRFAYLVEKGIIATEDSEVFGGGDKGNLRGYDIDGVLTEGVIPKKPYVVISGRTIGAWKQTLKDVGDKVPIYLRPYGEPANRDLSAKWKAEMIGRLGVKEFHEDDPYIADLIQRDCPSVKIVLHLPNETALT